jgi:hypothetical protein
LNPTDKRSFYRKAKSLTKIGRYVEAVETLQAGQNLSNSVDDYELNRLIKSFLEKLL